MLLEQFLTYIRAERRYSEHTALNYGRDVQRFFRFLAGENKAGPSVRSEIDPAIVTADDIRDWIMSLSASGLSASSVNRMTCSLRAFYRWCRKTGHVEKDPFLRIGFQKAPKRLPVWITEIKMDELLNSAKIPEETLPPVSGPFTAEQYHQARNRLLILLLYSTGIRLAEVLDIKLEDFSQGFNELKVRGKGDKERVIPIIGQTSREIVNFIDRFKDDKICFSPQNWLFLTEKGKHLSRTAAYTAVRAEMEKAGVQGKRSPHVLRHTFATHMLNEGADIREIQELMGHSSLSATQVYTHNSIAKLKEAYGKAHPRRKKSRE